MLSGQFGLLLLLAFAIATPVAWLTCSKWLANFSYKVPISPVEFLITFTCVSVGSAVVIAAQALKVSGRRAAEILKVE